MEWFYRVDGKKTGPISSNDLKAFYKAKAITTDTLVRREGMADWQPLQQFVKGAPPPPPAPVITSSDEPPLGMETRDLEPPPETAPTTPATQPSSRCSECGRMYDPDDLIRFDDALICAACKPIFTQKLREGVRIQGVLAYAGFWVRFGAKFIDTLLLTIVSMALGAVFGLTLDGLDESGGPLAANFFLQFINLCIPAVYSTFFLGRYGATLGKMACGLKVVQPDGEAISYPRALGRHFAEYLSGLILGIGYIMAAFDSEKRTLHDRICNTRVVRK